LIFDNEERGFNKTRQFEKCSPPPFEKGGLRGIYFIKSLLTPLFQRGKLNAYKFDTLGHGFRVIALKPRKSL